MTSGRDRHLVTTDWLAGHLDAPDVAIVDGSWYLPAMQRNARAEYEERHIPGAVFFDIDEISDTASDLPHMLPDPVKFSARVRRLGIGDGQKIVVYDGAGLFSAARVWWMFRVMGAPDVAVLDGGLPKWLAEGRPADDRPARRIERHFTARLDNTVIRSKDDVRRNIETGSELVIDARAAPRFRGEAPEPRPGIRSGHIPGSANVPFTDLLDEDGAVLGDEALDARLRSAGWAPGRKVITSCGSGVTAAAINLALAVLGDDGAALYDGSWAEWGADPELPAAAGADA